MATINQIGVACRVLSEFGAGDQHSVCAEHDELWMGHGCGPDKIGVDLAKELWGAGWQWDTDADAWHQFV